MVPVVDLTAYKKIICGQRNTGDTKKNLWREDTIYHPRKKKRLPYKWKAKTVARKQNPRDVNASTSALPGTKQPVPGRAPFDASRSPSSTVAPVLSLGTPRAAVLGGFGAVARSWEVGWRSGAAGVNTKTESAPEIQNDILTIITTYLVPGRG